MVSSTIYFASSEIVGDKRLSFFVREIQKVSRDINRRSSLADEVDTLGVETFITQSFTCFRINPRSEQLSPHFISPSSFVHSPSNSKTYFSLIIDDLRSPH